MIVLGNHGLLGLGLDFVLDDIVELDNGRAGRRQVLVVDFGF